MKHCSSCGRQIPESVAICSECEQWAADSVTGAVADVPPEAVAVPSQPSVPPAQAGTPSPASKRGVGRRELLVILIAVVGGGLITLALLSTRGPSAAVAAARVDAPARTPASAPSAPPASVVHQKWNSENRADWVGNQRNAAVFELPAENPVPIWMSHVRPMLVVRCVSKSTQVLVWTGSALKMEPQSEAHTVTFRFDNEPERTERWSDSDEHDALFAPDGAGFARRLIPARTMRFGYTPHNAAPAVADFQVSGLGELVEAFAKECGWKKDI